MPAATERDGADARLLECGVSRLLTEAENSCAHPLRYRKRRRIIEAHQPENDMTEAQAIDRLIANKQQRTPFRQTEYVGQQKKARAPAADRVAERAWQDRMIAMAAGQK